MAYLICYDIEDDKTRKKISDRLIADGLHRVQYSVFMGHLSRTLLKKLTPWLEDKVNQPPQLQDTILILNLRAEDLEKMTILGKDDIDLDDLLGRRHTLIL